MVDGETMPLLPQPEEPIKNHLESSLLESEALKKKKKDWFEQMIIKSSAVLLGRFWCARGFRVKNAEDLQWGCGGLWVGTLENMRYFGPSKRTNI